MTRQEIFDAVEKERAYQDGIWGREFDDKNTSNDWIAYITKYLGQALTLPWNKETFQKQILKAMTLCCAVLERDSYAARHYDV
jgi:hypothetical protein